MQHRAWQQRRLDRRASLAMTKLGRPSPLSRSLITPHWSPGQHKPAEREDPMAVLTVIARLKAKPGREKDLEATLRGLIPPTKAEKGCLQYDLHRSADDPGLFIFYENWESRPLWDDHMTSPHLEAFGGKQDELVESWELFTGEKL
jgi:quinol monooxygenase YgiN